MIVVAVTDYDDEGIYEHCENGWRRFCADTLVRARFHLRQLGKRASSRTLRSRSANRRNRESLRRQAAAYLWVFCGTGGDFSFDQVCEDLGLCGHLVRQRLLSECQPSEDINTVVRAALRNSGSCPEEFGDEKSIVEAVMKVRVRSGIRVGRIGRQTHASCSYRS